MFWIVMLVIVNDGLVKAQPVIHPSGTVDVVEGQNFTLTCSSENSLTVGSGSCRWDEFHSTEKRLTRLYLNYNENGECTKTFGNDSLYGFRCQDKNTYDITIYNARFDVNNNTKWWCTQIVTNGNLVDSATVTIRVKVRIKSVTMTPQTSPVSIIEGNQWQFVCITSFGSPAATVTWYKTGGTLGTTVQTITANVTDEPSEQGTRSTLRFFPNRNDHNVTIYCSAQNVGSMLNSAFQPTVQVLYGPSNLKCTYKDETVSWPIHIIEGETLRISCSSNSNPSPNGHQWRFSGGSQAKEQLSLPNIQRSHNGSFKYEVHNSMSPSGASSVSTGVSELTVIVNVLYPPSSPTFTIGNSQVAGKVKIIGGNNKTIRCSSDSNPSSNYTWNLLDGSTSGRDLILYNVQHPTNNGQYTCTARNVMRPTGEEARSVDSFDNITVDVLYPPTTLTFHYGNTSGSTIASLIAVVKGEAHTVYCIAIANPPPFKYMWGNSERQSLFLTNVQANTSSTCIATNHMTEESSYEPGNQYGDSLERSINKTLRITVWAPPQKPTIYFATGCSRNSPLTSPEFKVVEGGTFCLECSAESSPSPSFTWSGEKTITGHVLRVNGVRKDIIANNTCTARNTMVTTFSGNVTRESQTSIFINVLYSPQVGYMDNKSVVRGDNISFECPFTEGNPSFTSFIWTHDRNGSIKSRIQALSIPDVQRNDAGTYTCETTNEMRPTESEIRHTGKSTGNFHLDVLFGAENLQFKMNDDSRTTIEMPEKSNVSIACSVESNPASHMTISKDGLDIVSENDVTFLMFSRQARCEDDGVYVCTGNNGYPGRPSSSKTLHVTCSPRRLPVFDIKQNVSSALGSNSVLEFRVQAYPLPTEITWERCTPNCTKIEHDGKFNISSKNGLQFFLTIGNVTKDDYTQYKFTVVNGIGEPWQELFSLIPYDKPQPPTNFRYIPESMTTSSVTLAWIPGFNGGPVQTFEVLLRSEYETTWEVISINQTSQNEMNLSISNLSPGTSYDTIMFARNKLGNSSTSAVLTFALPQEIIDPPTANAALIGGLAGGGTFVVLLAIGALVFYKRKLGTHKPDSTQLTTRHNMEILEGDSDSDDVVENMMYESGGVVTKNPQSADNLYASPLKKKTTKETGDVYAVVNKKHKREKPKDKKEKISENDIYEYSESAKTSYQNQGFDGDSKQGKQLVNADGLLYADLVFANPPKGQRKLIIHGLDDMTEYAEVDLTKKADPLPDSDDESAKADK